MTNFEKYKDEILKITTETHDIPAMEDGRLQKCSLTSCEMCKFEDDDRNGCGGNFVKWLCEDDGEEPDGCNGCKYEYKREDESPCTECCNNYTSKWKRRPKKTRQDKFLECYPNVRKCKGVIDVCPKDLDMHFYCRTEDSHSGGCTTCCQDYWLQEVEE